ncbi:hypothetical protein [Prevotella heparinolytica]|uniref:hypothetical protein n=1 Tax=Prevotella heparinolytica TaxID=28113 RepID=UPI0010418001|nr:hypothetical protein [Bacteroides heparinolyticus]
MDFTASDSLTRGKCTWKSRAGSIGKKTEKVLMELIARRIRGRLRDAHLAGNDIRMAGEMTCVCHAARHTCLITHVARMSWGTTYVCRVPSR